MEDSNTNEISTPNTRALDPISSKSTDIPATKQFAVNATGNLFVATTLNGSANGVSGISAEAEEAFGQVSVFFAAMTKAMSDSGKSLYDVDALNKLIAGSGLFVKVSQTNTTFKSNAFGLSLSSELIQMLLGLSGNLAAIGKSLAGLIKSVGQVSVTLSKDETQSVSNVGSIIFVCEYLLGAVSIVPIVVSTSTTQAAKSFTAGPCLKSQSSETKINFQKDTYLFVPPTFVKYAADLNEAMSDPEFVNLIEKMKQDINADAPPAKPVPEPQDTEANAKTPPADQGKNT